MARPKKYQDGRIDTKVRLRADHRDLLDRECEARRVSRNVLIEAALDRYFGIRATAPRLAKPDPGQALNGPRATTPARVAPRVPHVGEAQQAALPEAPRVTEKPVRTRRRPRKPYG